MALQRPPFPRLKLCGLTRRKDVVAAIDCGADAIGLNFYSGSPRYVSSQTAMELSQVAKGHVLRVGVFVNSSPDEIGLIAQSCELDCIQLHGNESVEWLEHFANAPSIASLPILRSTAWRGIPEDAARLQAWSSASRSHGNRLLGWLVDAFDPVQHGGTGKTARWDLLQPRPSEFDALPFLLAGGLTPENVQSALESVQPDGVDIASGIEIAPGIKDHAKMKLIGDIVRDFYAR